METEDELFIFLYALLLLCFFTLMPAIVIALYAWKQDRDNRSDRQVKMSSEERAQWLAFINRTAGSLADDPVDRPSQGKYEKREPIDG